MTYDPTFELGGETPATPYRRIRVLMEIERYRLEGTITLPPPQGYRNRLSDIINYREGDFLPVTEVTVSQFDGSAPWQLPFAMVARAHIRLIAPIGGDEA